MTTPTIPDAWYAQQAERPLDTSLLSLRDDEAEFFKAQTGITDDGALREHILDVQRRAFQVWPYPCIRRVRRFSPGIALQFIVFCSSASPSASQAHR